MADEGFLQAPDDADVPVTDAQESMPGLAGHIQQKFEDSENGRRNFETRWLQAYKNYRGIYDSSTQYRDSERSRVFIKITKTKVLAAYGQIIDILFANKKFPIAVESSPVPEGIVEYAHLKTPADEIQSPFGFPGDGMELEPGQTELNFGKYQDMAEEIAEGPSRMGEPQFEPAKEAARALEKVIHDQLLDTDAVNVLRYAIFESSMLGTGIIKGPFNFYDRTHRWERGEDGARAYVPEEKIVPRIEHVSVWDFHPDPSATSIDDCEYVIQRHRMNRQQLRSLMNRPYFFQEAVENAIVKGPNYEDKYYEDTIREDDTEPYYQENRYEVLEYWGIIDQELAEEAELDIPKEYADNDQIQINAWICNGQIIRLVLNPFTPNRIPYHSVPYEHNPYSFFGIGVAENMEDTQLLMNGFYRLGIDNAALSGNLLIEVDETNLVPGQDLTVYPGKVFRRQGGQVGTAIHGTKFPNVSNELMMMYDKARQLADEATGIPSYSHGGTGITGVGRTASGMSMLMGAAQANIKAVVRNIDDYLLAPLGKALFSFNMQFLFDKEFVGDLDVLAKGTESLMRNEIRSQRLLQFMQMTQNPQMAPFVKYDYVLRELAASMDLDEDKILNDQREAVIQAKMMSEIQAMMPQQPQQQQEGGPPSPSDPTGTGGGNIAPGAAPEPGAEGFTGAGGGDNGGNTQPDPNQAPQGPVQ